MELARRVERVADGRGDVPVQPCRRQKRAAPNLGLVLSPDGTSLRRTAAAKLAKNGTWCRALRRWRVSAET